MAYANNYTTADLSLITVDAIATGGVEVVGFMGLIVITLILAVLIGIWRKMGR